MTSSSPSRPRSPAEEGWHPPAEFDEYRLVRQIGRGGNGLVYAAHDKLLDRVVAIKFILTADPNATTRMLIEARAAARIQHPNIASVYRIGELDGRPFLVSEFVHGKSLDEIPRPMKPGRAMELALGLARGLAAAHRLGVLHRDLKPSNALVSDAGEVKLVDFGLAKFIDSTDTPAGLPTKEEAAHALALPRLTHAGAIVGTPYYMAPEAWRGEVATRRSDVYSMGILFYEICSGDVPFGHIPPPDLPTAAQSSDPPPLGQHARGFPPAFCAIVDRCLRRNPEERFRHAEELVAALEQLAPGAKADVLPAGNPYRGLEAFGAEHRALFFGRAAEIRAVIDRLRGDAFVLIAGDSGVGKSSLAAAGVVPRLLEGALADGRVWATSRMVPGRRPLGALTTALASALTIPEEELRLTVGRGPVETARAVRRKLRASAGLLLYLDQLEELVTLSPLADAAPAAEILGELCAGVPGVRIIATARSDFLTRLAALPGFGTELERALYLLRPLTVDGLRQVIVGPAQSKGVRFENDELVDALVSSAARAEGGLPLLQFTLAELWDARDRDVITAASLTAIGNVEGALARHADGVIDRMLPAQRKAARSVLLRLVTIDGTRARRTEDELTTSNKNAAKAAIEALVRGRLVVARQGEGGATYEVAHEALLAGWSRLRKWLEEEAESRAVLHRLETAAAEWERLGRSRDALWSSRQLFEVALVDPDQLGPRESAFVSASRGAARRRRLLQRVVIAAIPLIAIGVWAGFRLSARRDLNLRIEAALRDARARLGTASEIQARYRAATEGALAYYDAHDPSRGEQAWTDAQSLSSELERAWSSASEALERATALDATRKETRGLIGDLLLARALEAERMNKTVDRGEVTGHLTPYDDDGHRRAVWNAPARVNLRTAPENARIRLWRVERGDAERRIERDQKDLGSTPVSGLELSPGDYLLELTSPGRVVVRYPLLARRGEQLDLTVDLPAAEEAPKGFVFVPAGRFLFGSSVDEAVRRDFFNTTPLHAVTTNAFWIARNETTFGEWIEFLRSLVPSERAKRLPRASGGRHGILELTERADGVWHLKLAPASVTYEVAAGEKIVYASRKHRTQQDWLRMPVAAISFDDLQAYAHWLDATGRVRGARACTELEWERAARGADDRIFPHGDRLDPDDANHDATYGREPGGFGPDEVGSHPISRSPFGLDDVAGNVWEWTSSALGDGKPVARGGAYYYKPIVEHIPNREVVEPTDRDMRIGIRICADSLKR